MPDFALSRISTYVFHAWTSFQLDSAWTVDYRPYNFLLFHCILTRLAMCHIRVLDVGILENLNAIRIGPSLASSHV